jgi:alcohol dehydrogenase class IV
VHPTSEENIVRTFAVPPAENIIYGEGAFDSIGDLVDRTGGSKVAVVMSTSLAGGWVEDALRARLGGRLAGIHAGIPQHVPRHAVLAAADTARSSGADCVMSVGGGTPIDCAKAVALCLAGDIRTVEDFERFRIRFTYPDQYEVPEYPTYVVPHVAVPTTLSGGEHTGLFGVTDETTKFKGAYSSPAFAPRAVVLDPAVCAATPGWLWAASGMRAVDHAVEGILSARSMPMADALGAEALRLLVQNLAHSTANPDDAEARTNCLLGTWLSIFALTNVGVGLSHGIGHQLATEFDMIHGVTSAIMLPRVMEFNAAYTAPKLRRIAEAMGHDTRDLDDATASKTAIDAVRDLVTTLGVPDRISAAGGRRDALPAIARHAIGDSAVAASPRPITEADILDLLESAW